MALSGPGVLFEESTVGTSANKIRNMIDGLLATPGVAGVNDLFVQANSSPGQNVQIQEGGVFLQGTDPGQGTYSDYNDGLETLPMPPADSGAIRVDRVVYRVLDAEKMLSDPNTTGGSPHFSIIDNLGHFDYLQGDPGGAWPPLERDMLPLARVTRPQANNVITGDLITDERPFASAVGGMSIVTSTTRPSMPRIGQEIYEYDTHQRYMWDGSYWSTYMRPLLKADGQNVWTIGAGQRTTTCYIPMGTLVTPVPCRLYLRVNAYVEGTYGTEWHLRAWDGQGHLLSQYTPAGQYVNEFNIILFPFGDNFAQAFNFSYTYMRDYNAGETIGGTCTTDWYSANGGVYWINAQAEIWPRVAPFTS